jgi:hypothetical protein
MSLFIELLLIMALKAISIFSIIYTGINSHGGHPGWMIVCNKKRDFQKVTMCLVFCFGVERRRLQLQQGGNFIYFGNP